MARRVRRAVKSACGRAVMCGACAAKGGCGKGCGKKAPNKAEEKNPAMEIFSRVVAELQDEHAADKLREEQLVDKLMDECRQLPPMELDPNDATLEPIDELRDQDTLVHEVNEMVAEDSNPGGDR